MTTKTLKIVGYFLGSILLAVGGLVFAASFAVDTLQSWPKALMEARTMLYGQIILGAILGTTTGKWQRWLNITILGATGIALCAYAWYGYGLPGTRFWFCVSGMFTFVFMGGYVVGGLVREYRGLIASEKRTDTPTLRLTGDNWKN